jgi:hypothetical protein
MAISNISMNIAFGEASTASRAATTLLKAATTSNPTTTTTAKITQIKLN